MRDPLFPRKFVAAGRPGAYPRLHAGHAAGGRRGGRRDRPDHGVSVGLVYEVSLRAPWRLSELEPPADMNPSLTAWLYRAA